MSTFSPTSAVAPLTFDSTADFDHLLDAAREHLRELAGRIWTDHNTHDPGITILEVLCFAIADLSYRTSFDVKDLLAAYPGDKQLPLDLPPADVALPNHPLTVQDLRKVLLDLSHPDQPQKLLLRNAWPLVADECEQAVYVVEPGKEPGRLDLDPGVPLRTGGIKPLPEVSLSETQLSGPTKTKYVSQLVENEDILSSSVQPVSRVLSRDEVMESGNQERPLPTTKDAGITSVSLTEQIVAPGNPIDPPVPPAKDSRASLRLNGIYGIQLEFEEDRNRPEYWLADLNRNYFETSVHRQGQSHRLSVLMPYWDQVNWSLKDLDMNQTAVSFSTLPNSNRPYFIAVDKLNYDDHFYDYYAEFLVGQHPLNAYINVLDPIRDSISDGVHQYQFRARWLDWNELANGVDMDYSTVTYQVDGVDFVGIDAIDPVFDLRVTFDSNLPDGKTYPLLLRIEFDPGQALPGHFVIQAALIQKFNDLYQSRINLENEIRDELLDAQSNIYAHYLSKLKEVFRLVYGTGGVWEYLGDYRNLCEDFGAFSASRVQEIALFGKVLVRPGHNPNQVLGEVFYRVDQFLNPLVRFRTLDELTAAGLTFDEIFNGPLLRHGFIEAGDLETLNRRSVIYTSDLVSLIMDVEGVEAVEGFSISSYIDNRLMGRKVTNCLSLTYPDVYRPRLSVDKSILEVWSGNAPETTGYAHILDWYRHRLDEHKASQLPEGPVHSLELPRGRDRQTGRYKSIQHDFPLVYGIGPFGLPNDAEPERRARARQLKAFLLPFEQLLANYLRQISHLPELFSINPAVDTTYQHAPLYEVPGVAPLFRPFLQSGQTWDQFKADLDNAYRLAARSHESREEWLNRRNRFLDHLLGRFAEGFSRYAMQLFDRHKYLLDQPGTGQWPAYQEARQNEMERLIGDKIAFAADLPLVTSGRSHAFNYLLTGQPNGGWGSHNISGYKRRLCRLLGIHRTGHEFLFNQPDPEDPTHLIDLEGMHVLEHILIRPRRSPATLLPLENQSDGAQYFIYEADRDPYSFCLTLVLPGNAGRFREEPFRRFAEMLIREETPAHIRLDIRWMAGRCGQRFEEAFANWLGQTHVLSPWLFQHADQRLQPFSAGLMSYFKAQDTLVATLNRSCELRLEVFDQAQQPILPLHGVVRFHAGPNDIGFLQVSEPGGSLQIMYRSQPSAKWQEAAALDPVDETWLRAERVTGSPGAGLTTGLHGEGQYLLVYTLDRSPVSLSVEVLPPLEPVRVQVVRGEQYLLSQPGIPLKIDPAEVRDYALVAAPLLGQLQVSVMGGPWQAVPFAPAKKNQWRMSDFLRSFGAGPLSIRYTLQDRWDELQVVFVEEMIAPAIRVSNVDDPKTELVPDGNGRIALLPEQNKVRLDLSPGGGALRISQGSEAFGEVILERENADLVEFDMRDMILDMRDPAVWVSYQFRGQTARVVLEYRTRREPEPPALDLLANGLPVEEMPARIDPTDPTVTWSFHIQPVGGMLYFYRLVDKERAFLSKETVTERNQDQRLEVGEIWRNHGDGHYLVEYVTPGGFATVDFVLEMPAEQQVWTSRLAAMLVELPGEAVIGEQEGVYPLRFDFREQDQAFEFRFRAGDGRLRILDAGEEVLVMRSPSPFVLRAHDIAHGSYRIEYQPNNGEPLSSGIQVWNLDPRFRLGAVTETDADVFAVETVPVGSVARTYIWRLDEVYVSRAKSPTLALDFREKEQIEIQLAVFIDGESEMMKLVVTPEMLREQEHES